MQIVKIYKFSSYQYQGFHLAIYMIFIANKVSMNLLPRLRNLPAEAE
ncbi:hypothetical protein HMPREF3034_01142 [Prevotella sp. DNF00663]|nr:hypothetical protein HMPREF3034_01142 [Prevotella sp. DNF00663]